MDRRMQLDADCDAGADDQSRSTFPVSAQAMRAEFDREASHEQRMAVLGELSAGIVHDFRNTLQAMTATLELIDGAAAKPDSVRRLAASGLRATQKGSGLVDRLLAFARQEKQSRQVVNVLPSMGEVADMLDRLLGAHIRLTMEEPVEELWPTSVDLQAFELALLNLGINARDAMPDGGLLRFRARNVTLPRTDRRQAGRLGRMEADRRGPPLVLSGGDYVSVSVTDTGTGMDPETLSRAMLPFFTTKPQGKGTGLGLPMVHDFATQHAGTVRLISQPGYGTTVEIWLPKEGAA